MFVMGTTEIQFLAYLQLIRNRLKLLNKLFKNFQQVIKNRKVENSNNDEMKHNIESGYDINQQFYINELSTFKRKIINEHTLLQSRNPNSAIQKPKTPKVYFKNVAKTVAARNKVNDLLNVTFYRSIDYTDYIIRIQHIYSKLEKVALLINSSYGVQIVFILIIKFTTLTSLLYFCCMILLK